MKTWNDIKQEGSAHYKSNATEPIDLYKAGGILRDLAVGSIIKYAYRNRSEMNRPVSKEDMKKIRHYSEILECFDEET